MGLYFNQLYATQSTTLPSGPTANRISGGYRIDRDLAPKLFVFGTADFDYDKFLSLDLRFGTRRPSWLPRMEVEQRLLRRWRRQHVEP